jgi:mannose-6-phosphate isomerase-like protein (cupin superfamily)
MNAPPDQHPSELLATMQAFVTALGDGVVTSLAGPLLSGDLKHIHVVPDVHPALDHISELDSTVFPAAAPLYRTLKQAIPALRWQVSYTAEDGFSDDYLQNYAWCDVIGPEGVYLSGEYRIGFGYWREGIQYPTHAHEPEEIYLVVAGSGIFTTGDTPPRTCGPGDVVHHTPFLPHSIDMSDGPLLVMFLWRGANLHRKSDF